MKKKIVLSLMLIVSLFMITGCGSKKESNKEKEKKVEDTRKEIVLKDEGYGTTTFKYDKDKDYEIKEETGGKYKELIISSETENFELQIYHTDQIEASYEIGKNNRSNSSEFKEYTWNKYNGYSYNGSKTSISFNILLEDGKVLFGVFDSINADEADMPETFKGDSIQSLLKSITFKSESE